MCRVVRLDFACLAVFLLFLEDIGNWVQGCSPVLLQWYFTLKTFIHRKEEQRMYERPLSLFAIK